LCKFFCPQNQSSNQTAERKFHRRQRQERGIQGGSASPEDDDRTIAECANTFKGEQTEIGGTVFAEGSEENEIFVMFEIPFRSIRLLLSGPS